MSPHCSIRHRPCLNVVAATLVPKPITDDHIVFQDVIDTMSGQVAGQEVVYVPLQEDPMIPSTSTATHPLGSIEELVYQTMTVHASCLTQNIDPRHPLNQYFMNRQGGKKQ